MSAHLSPILMVGCGNMGGALVQGWSAAGFSQDAIRIVTSSDASAQQWVGEGYISYVGAASVQDDFYPRFIVLGVKPDQIKEVASDVQHIAEASEAIIVSLAAGVPLQTLDAHFSGLPICRVMPNTPVRIRQGISGCIGNASLDAEQRDAVHALFSQCGTVHWLRTEEDMHSFTALCGSGPAYVFHFMEALRDAALEYGMDAEVADGLARRMVLGASLLACQSDAGLAELREAVTSKGGTTAAGLSALMEGAGGVTLNRLCDMVIERASERSKELAE